MRAPATASAFVIALALVSIGCGENHITEGEAEEGWRVIDGPLQKGQQRTQKKARELGLKLVTRDEPVTVTEDCETSGDAKFELDVVTSGGDASVQNPRFDFTVEFRGCESMETVADGTLDIDPPDDSGNPGNSGNFSGNQFRMRPLTHIDEDTGNTDADADASRPSDAVGYEGRLEYVGDVDGPCPVDMYILTGDAQPTYGGTWCGYDAGDVIGFSFGG